MEKVEELYNLIDKANDQLYQLWLSEMVFTWRWWLGVGLTIIPWLLWFKFRKKESSDRLLYVGYFVILISSWLDLIGIILGWWFYKSKVIPVIPAFIPWDITLMPVSVMFLIQYKPNISPYIKGTIFGFTTAFIAEPFFQLIGLYETKQWEFVYSFPIYLLIYLVSNHISKRNSFQKI